MCLWQKWKQNVPSNTVHLFFLNKCSKHGTAFRLSLHLWVICGAQMHNTHHYLLKTNLPLCCYCVLQYISDKTEELTIAFKLQGCLLCVICYSLPPLRLLHAHFFGISVQQSVTTSHPANEPRRQLPCPPASSLRSGQQTVEEWVGLLKLMVHALLPGLKMNWNVVYLKRTRPPHRKKDHNTEAPA